MNTRWTSIGGGKMGPISGPVSYFLVGVFRNTGLKALPGPQMYVKMMAFMAVILDLELLIYIFFGFRYI